MNTTDGFSLKRRNRDGYDLNSNSFSADTYDELDTKDRTKDGRWGRGSRGSRGSKQSERSPYGKNR